MTLGQRIRQLRTTRGLSMREFARAAGVDLSRIETDQRPTVNVWTVQRIAGGLGMTVDELLKGVVAPDTCARK